MAYNKEWSDEDRKRWEARVEAVLSAAHNNWDRVIRTLAPQLGPVIDKTMGKKSAHTFCPNPMHGRQSGDAMRCYEDFAATGGMVCNTCGSFSDGIALLRWWNPSWGYGQTIKEIESVFGGPRIVAAQPSQPRAPVKNEADQEEVRKRDSFAEASLLKVRRDCIPILHPDALIGQTYLLNRGIDVHRVRGLQNLWFHPALDVYCKDPDNKSVRAGKFPALVYLISTSKGERGTLHRTYLAPDGSGKAPVEKKLQRKVMSRLSHRPISGGACQLTELGDVPILGIGEGLETALSAHMLSRLPTWCAYSAQMLESFVPPESVRYVVIWADYDLNGAGMRSAERLLTRLRAQGLRAVAQYPTYPLDEGQGKMDWNDAVNRYGIETLRKQSFFTTLLGGLQAKLATEGTSLERVLMRRG